MPKPGPTRSSPTDPGGLDVAGESETAVRTSAGEDTDAQLDLSKLPRRRRSPFRSPRRAEARSATKTRSSRSRGAGAGRRQPTGGKGSVIQLGAFANRAQAERAWSALSARFPSVAVDEQADHSLLRRNPAPRRGRRRRPRPSRRARRSRSRARIASWPTDAGGDLRPRRDGNHRRKSATSSAMPTRPVSSCSSAIAKTATSCGG